MKKLFSLLVAVFLLSAVVPTFASTPGGSGESGVWWEIDEVGPNIWMDPDVRALYHNPADGGWELIERMNNYAFEGEQLVFDVLVADCNGIEKISDVWGGVGDGSPDPYEMDQEVNCDESTRTNEPETIGVTCENCCIDPGEFDPDIMRWYTCTLTVESEDSMYGEYWVAAVVEDLDGLMDAVDEFEYWFFNPEIAIDVDDIYFSDPIGPGDRAYAITMLIQSEVDDDSGVVLDMAISGTDFYDPAHSGAKCPISNVLNLNNGGTTGFDPEIGSDQWRCAERQGVADNFCYFATQGAYTTYNDGTRADVEGYVGIPYETGDRNDRAPIISSDDVVGAYVDVPTPTGPKRYYFGNMLNPGSEIAFTLRLDLPVPCNGEFTDGSIYFWATAI